MAAINPNVYFNPIHFTEFYNEKMKTKKGGGFDGLTPTTFWNRYVKELDEIAKRCLNGTYQFSFYKEKLVLKGKGKLPRVLSIPSMRDRMVLGVLNQYLQDSFPKAVNHEVPNQYIKEVSDFLAEHSSEKIYFLKTDIKGFYDSINLNMLYAKLESCIDDNILQLIMTAIDTITLSDSHRTAAKQRPRDTGIPQGLAISNVLANISMLDFDASIHKCSSSDTLYKRYVDDILILSTSPIDSNYVNEIKCELILKGVSLRLSADKTLFGLVGEESFDYIGYTVKSPFSISIRERNVQAYLNRISKIVTKYRGQKANAFLRPRFIFEDKAFDEYYVSLINQKLSGIKISNHLYGWLPYFQAMTDVQLLYGLDTVIHKKFMKGLKIESQIVHLHEVYWDIKKHAGKNKLMDFDALKDVGDMRSYLLKQGLIDEDVKYNDDEIETKYYVHLERLKKDARMTVGMTY